jgi:hypothetical protein
MSLVDRSLNRGAGYLRNGVEEADIRTCTHCQVVIRLERWRKQGAWCPRCFAPVCHACGVEMQRKGCVPFLKKIEAFAEQMVRFDQLGLLEKNAAGHVISQPAIILPGA